MSLTSMVTKFKKAQTTRFLMTVSAFYLVPATQVAQALDANYFRHSAVCTVRLSVNFSRQYDFKQMYTGG